MAKKDFLPPIRVFSGYCRHFNFKGETEHFFGDPNRVFINPNEALDVFELTEPKSRTAPRPKLELVEKFLYLDDLSNPMIAVLLEKGQLTMEAFKNPTEFIECYAGKGAIKAYVETWKDEATGILSQALARAIGGENN